MSGVADTAKLLASLDLQDQMSPKLRGAIGTVGQAESRIGSLGSKLSGFASNLKGNIGNAIGTFGGRIKQLGGALLGLAGIGGIFGIGAFLRSSLDKVRDFGSEVVRIIDLTRLSTIAASHWAAAFEHFGIAADTATGTLGRLLKNVGVITESTKKEIAFTLKYGVELRTSTISVKQLAAAEATLTARHKTRAERLAATTLLQKYFNSSVKDANELLLTGSDIWLSKTIPQTEKAVILQKLFGKTWQDFLPILKAGRKGLSDLAIEADKYGLTLNDVDLKALKANKDATRDFHTALSGLEIQIGAKLLPTFTKFVQGATAFVSEHRTDILKFFQNLADFIGSVAEAVTRIPSGLGITDLIKGAVKAWDALPGPLRDLLVKGAIADRTVKFLFGFSPVGTIGSAIGGAISSALAAGLGKAVGSGLASAGLGKLFVQPVFVTNPGFGGLPGGAAGAAAGAVEGAAGAGILTVALTAGTVALLAGVLAAGVYRIATGASQGIRDPRLSTGSTSGKYGQFVGNSVTVKNTVNVVDNSPGAREERAVALRAALASASANERTAEHTEALNAGLNAKQERSIAKLEAIRRAAQRQADKREDNRITVNTRIPIFIRIAARTAEAGATVTKTVTRDGSPVAY